MHNMAWFGSRTFLLVGTSFTSMAAGALLTLALGHQAKVVDMPIVKPRAASASRLSTPAALDSLRDDAAVGDVLASRNLTGLLLDRYDRFGDSDDLYEALVWIERNLFAAENAALTQRIATQYCDQRVARWHSLCNPGE